MTMTDLGVECMVGLCMAAAIWWVARRRCRTHTEEPKTRFESVDPAKAMPLVDDASAAAAEEDALLAEGDTSERTPHDETDAQLDDGVASLHSLVEHDQQSREPEDEDEDEDVDEEEDDDAAETDVTEHDVDDQDEEDEEYVEEEEEVPMDDQMKEALARAEAMAATMGVNAFGNMTESVMAMEEFLVLDAPLSPAQPGTEAERMQMEDPAPIEAQHAQDEAENAAEELEQELEQEQDDDDLVTVEYVEEDDEAKPPAAAPTATSEGEASGVMSAFWAKCENKDECSLCNTSFSFLARRHHCRKCRASVCGGCSANSAALAEFGGSVERVCDRCWATMQMAAADHHGDVLQDEEEKPLSS